MDITITIILVTLIALVLSSLISYVMLEKAQQDLSDAEDDIRELEQAYYYLYEEINGLSHTLDEDDEYEE